MKIIYIICAAALFSAGCKSKINGVKEKGTVAAKAFLVAHLPEVDTMYSSLDSLELISIDTITEKQELSFPINRAVSFLELYNVLTEHALNLSNKRLEIANLGARQYPNTVSNKAEFDAVKEENELVHSYHDTAMKYVAIIQDLKAKQENADSTVFKYFGFKFRVQYSLKDRTLKQDTILVPITSDFHVKTLTEISDKYFTVLH